MKSIISLRLPANLGVTFKSPLSPCVYSMRIKGSSGMYIRLCRPAIEDAHHYADQDNTISAAPPILSSLLALVESWLGSDHANLEEPTRLHHEAPPSRSIGFY
jgi:hypothetical protein